MSKSSALTARYLWEEGSPVRGMEVEQFQDQKPRVRLFASDEMEDGALAGLPKILHKYGFTDVYPEVHEGRNVLVVQNIDDEYKLIRALDVSGMAHGSPARYLPDDKRGMGAFERIPKGVWDTVKKDTLKWSGRVGLVGHAALLGAGAIQKDWNRMAAAPLGASNPIILSIYGNGKDNVDFEHMLGKMREYFASEGIELPEVDVPEQKKRLKFAAERVLSSYPLQIGHALGSLGAWQVMQSGWKDKSVGRMIAGATSLTGNAAVVMVPERRKTKEERDNPKSLWDTVKQMPQAVGYAAVHPSKAPGMFWDFVRESPLRFNGMLNFSDNAFYLMDAFFEKSKPKKHAAEAREGIEKVTEEYISTVKAFFTKYQENPNLYSQSGVSEELAQIRNLYNKREGLWNKLRQNDPVAAQRFLDDTKGRIRALAESSREAFGKAEVFEKHAAELLQAGSLAEQRQLAKDFIASTEGAAGMVRKMSPALSFITAFSFGAATFLSAISSKNADPDKRNEEMYEKMYALTAKMLVPLPEEQREKALNRMAFFLGSQPDVQDGDITIEQIREEVKKRLEPMEHSPWVEKTMASKAAAETDQAQGQGHHA